MDISAAVAGLLHRVLPSLKWVKGDVTHMMRRIMRELPRGHPMISEKLIHGLLMYCALCLPASDRIVEQLKRKRPCPNVESRPTCRAIHGLPEQGILPDCA